MFWSTVVFYKRDKIIKINYLVQTLVFAHEYFLTIIQNIIAVTSKIIRITVPPKGIVTANKVVVHLLANVVCWSVEIMNGSVKNQFW